MGEYFAGRKKIFIMSFCLITIFSKKVRDRVVSFYFPGLVGMVNDLATCETESGERYNFVFVENGPTYVMRNSNSEIVWCNQHLARKVKNDRPKRELIRYVATSDFQTRSSKTVELVWLAWGSMVKYLEFVMIDMRTSNDSLLARTLVGRDRLFDGAYNKCPVVLVRSCGETFVHRTPYAQMEQVD